MANKKVLNRNIFLTGFSGTGKTTIARDVADLLGWELIDTDNEIVRFEGNSIEEIFLQDGEGRFRDLERECLAKVCESDRQVVATGGGITTDKSNRERMEGAGVIICLEARPETILKRLKQDVDSKGSLVRPMLAGINPVNRIVDLKADRQAGYSEAQWTVHTDLMTPAQVAAEVVRAATMLLDISDNSPIEPADLSAIVKTSSGSYPVWVGWEILRELGGRVRSILSPSVAYVITDENAQRHARKVQTSLESAGIAAHIFVLPPGEGSKSLDMANHLYGWLANLKAERGHLLVTVGGGVVGDLAGFVSATFLRGIPYGHVPTTLLGMMDASIGGKTAVDLPQGKNLVGSFYQPRFVMSDVRTLESLSERDRRSGWAEAIKHGLILDEGLLCDFEENVEEISCLEKGLSTEVIRKSVAIKARVVSKDENETLGVRILLNYGHTIGHAIEAATGYQRFLHGEAVSIGMMGAARISQEMGLLSESDVHRQQSILQRFRLPVHASGLDTRDVLGAMGSDKKTSEGMLRWVLLNGIGHGVIREDVPFSLVDSTVRNLGIPI